MLFLRWLELSLRKIQLFRFTKQFRIYGCQSAISALPPFIIHSVMTVFRRLWSFHATPVRLSTHTLNLANVIGVQCDSSTVCIKICPCVFWNSDMFLFSHSWTPYFKNRSITFFSYPFHSIEEVLNMRLLRFDNYMLFEPLILNHTIHKKIHLPHSFRDILPWITSFSNYIAYFLIWYESIRSNIYFVVKIF